VTITDADRNTRPVPRHALLISDNPSTAAPRRVVTAIDGTASVRLPPGNYTIESEEPLRLGAESYEWTRTVDVTAGRDAILDLTTDNAVIVRPSTRSSDAAGAAPAPGSPSALLMEWQPSILTIWSPTRQGSGFVIDARGLIATSYRTVGRASTVEAQFSPTMKVAARVLAADATKNIAILWVDPTTIASAKPVRLSYVQNGTSPVREREKVFAIEVPLDDRATVSTGTVSRLESRSIVSDLRLELESAGTPLFNTAGDVVGISTLTDESTEILDVSPRAVRIDEARALIADAEKKMQGAQPPGGTPLPVEPQRPYEDDALKEALKDRGGRLGAYPVAAADFDVTIITPVLLYADRHRMAEGRSSGRETRSAMEVFKSTRALQEFANWTDYVRNYPPVVMIRATPKLVENFWAMLGRQAAQSQGVSLPPIRRIKSGFASLRAFCGDAEVTPIHPFKIEQRVGASDVIYEGLYVFDPAALGPQCGTVRLQLFSDKAPGKPDTRAVDAKIVQQIWQDFAPYRAARQ
jgi:S1-C subfamily serine protease